MKKHLYRYLAAFMILVLSLTFIPIANVNKVAAATAPKISQSTKTLTGIGSTFTLSVKNLKTSNVKSTTWYSTNKKVITVDKYGYVTAVGKGTAWAKVKITYKNKTTKTLGCKVTVKIPATDIEFTNANDTEANNFRHVIEVGESYDFNAKMTPSNATDVITYSVDSKYSSILKLNTKTGVVTGLKPGFAIITVTASSTKAAAPKSYVKKSINIEIVDKTARVTSVTMKDSTTIVITFDHAVTKNTVIGDNDIVTNNISVSSKTNSKGVVANGVGTLKGSLSADGKTLTVTSSKVFSGLYGIHVSGNITTTDGINIEDYYKEVEFYDNDKPAFKDYTIDDTGLIVSINFTEAMDFSELDIKDAKVVTNGATAMPATISLLKTKANYKASEDGKSLIIDLTNISSYDRNKLFAVTMAGIKDLSGNYPASYPHTVYVATDTSYKAQAVLDSLERSSYNTLTATFNRAIQSPGYVYLSNGEMLQGVVDKDNNKKVNYILTTTAQQLTGSQKVEIGYWNGYNVNPSDTSANTLQYRYVDFTLDKTIPVITSYELVTETNGTSTASLLKLTFNKNVTLLSTKGTLSAKLVTMNNDIYGSYSLGYSAIVKDNVVTIVLDETQFTEVGTYTISIPSYFVQDSYLNTNVATTVTVQKGAGSSAELPAPKNVVQDPSNASIIYVTFAQKVDVVSAQNVSNYYIAGVTVQSAEVIDNSNNGSTIKLTLQAGSITYSTIYPITIQGIKGFNNTYSAMQPYSVTLYLNENQGPVITGVKYTYPNTVTLTYNEDVFGTASFKVVQDNKDLAYSFVVSGNTVVITLSDVPKMGTVMVITSTTTNNIKDVNGNASSATTRTVVPSN